MREEAPYVQLVHRFMLFLATAKALSLFFEAAKLWQYGSTGEIPTTWNVLFNFALAVVNVTLFGVIILLGAGWFMDGALLSRRVTVVLLIVLPSQIAIVIATALIEEAGEGSASAAMWRDALKVLDIVCCCSVLLPMVWSIKAMADIQKAEGEDENGKPTLTSLLVRRFRIFYLATVAYIYFTRIVMVLIDIWFPPSKLGASGVLRELVAVVFYAYVGYCFRPMKENPYLSLNEAEPGAPDEEGDTNSDEDGDNVTGGADADDEPKEGAGQPTTII